MKKIINWLGQEMQFEGTLGQAIANHKITNLPGKYIYDDGFINLTPDPEIPIKGFIILGTNKPYSSITEFSEEERMKISDISNRLVNTLHQIGFKEILIFQDEASKGQFHIWFLPRHEWTKQFSCNLNAMIEYSKKELNISENYRNELLECIDEIADKF